MCFNFKTLAPTEEAKELATSLAPIPKDVMKAVIKPTTNIQVRIIIFLINF
jgi:hypothetical protein